MILGNDFNWNIAYPISGLFSMYLVEKYGLPKYKLLFRADKGEKGFTDVYNLDYNTLLSDYYTWMDSI